MDSNYIPLAEKLRPKSFEDFIGQSKVLNTAIIKSIIHNKKPLSLLFYGPPGSGKTTLANILIAYYPFPHIELNGVNFSTQIFKKIAKELTNTSLLIIMDEIHRMNKLQQDVLLPYIENGKIFIIGTTTENPSFEINNALLSRMNIMVFEKLTNDDLLILIDRALSFLNININNSVKKFLIDFSNYDARQLLNILDSIKNEIHNIDDIETLKTLLNKKYTPYDKNGENHYNFISALHKSIRGSDPNASLYYFARMLNGGEDPLYVARRLIRIASEDIGNADTNALTVALNAYKTFTILGTPEGELSLAQCIIYLSLCPKSTAVYNAFNEAKKDAEKYSNEPIPLKLRNAPTKFNENMDHGSNYKYPPNFRNSFVNEKYFPDNMPEKEYYKPVERGFERDMKKRIEYFKKLRNI